MTDRRSPLIGDAAAVMSTRQFNGGLFVGSHAVAGKPFGFVVSRKTSVNTYGTAR